MEPGLTGVRGDGPYFASHTQELGAGLELWGSGCARWRAAPSRLLLVARHTARHMAGAGGARRRAVPSPLEAARSTVRRIVEAGGSSARWRAAPRWLLMAARRTASSIHPGGLGL
jgi:hypothetical protein